MTLSTKTVHNLASALTSDAIDYLHEDERYAEFMIEMIQDFLFAKMGQMNDELQIELTCCIMDRICFRKV